MTALTTAIEIATTTPTHAACQRWNGTSDTSTVSPSRIISAKKTCWYVRGEIVSTAWAAASAWDCASSSTSWSSYRRWLIGSSQQVERREQEAPHDVDEM